MKWPTLWIATLRVGLLTGGKPSVSGCGPTRDPAVRSRSCLLRSRDRRDVRPGRRTAPERRANLPVLGRPRPPGPTVGGETTASSPARAPRRRTQPAESNRAASSADLLGRRTAPSSPPATPWARPAAWTTSSNRSSGATARDVTTSKVRRAVQRPPPARGPPRPRRARGRRPPPAREGGASQQRLHQGDPQVRPGDRQHQPGRPGAAADVADGRCPRGQLAEDRAVQQVALPQPGHLARTDQPADHARGRPAGRRTLGQRQPVRREHPRARPG